MTFSFRNLVRVGWASVVGSGGSRKRAERLVARGIVAETSGNLPEALRRFRSAIETDGEFADAHMNLGIALQSTGDLAAAVDSYHRAIAIDPEFASAHYNLAHARLLQLKFSAAETTFRTALRIRREFPEALVGLSSSLEALGRNDEAAIALEKAISLRPDYVGALINAIVLQHKMGRIEAAANYSHRVLELEPENYLAHATLGVFEYGRGNLAEALSSLRLALTFNPEYSDAKRCLATVLSAMGQSHAAVPIFQELLSEQPSSPQARRDLAQALDGFVLNLTGARERDQFLSLCMDDSVSMLFLNPSIIAFIKGHAGFQLLQASIRQGIKSLDLAAPAIASFLREPILLAALPRAPMVDAEVEEVLTCIRRGTLLRFNAAFASADTTPDNFADFRFALARQCHFSGYIFHADEDELQQVACLRKALEEELAKATVNFNAIEPALLAFSLYESLHVLAASERMLERDAVDWSAAFRPIIREQLEYRMRERAIALDIPSLTPIDDRVSRAVRSQYEENPYPRWATVQFPKPEAFEVLARRWRPAAEIRVRPRPVPMIVAGCGTGHLPILYALLQPDSEILAVDLSLASLAYAARMTAQFGISNIAYAQADILELGSLGRRFALVECSGVLHHLDNPMAGWRVLVDLMEPDGLMKISLYSQAARRSIQAARELVRSLGLPPSPEGLRRCRRAIAALPEGHPARKVTTYGDFYVLDGCRDMLMNVQEHQFTLPRIEKCLEELGLQFLGMECKPAVRSQFNAMFAQRGANTSLSAWHQFEEGQPDTFLGMYAFWCCRK